MAESSNFNSVLYLVASVFLLKNLHSYHGSPIWIFKIKFLLFYYLSSKNNQILLFIQEDPKLNGRILDVHNIFLRVGCFICSSIFYLFDLCQNMNLMIINNMALPNFGVFLNEKSLNWLHLFCR